MDRTKSHEVTSGAVAGAPVFISTERLQEMVEMLQTLPETEQQGGHLTRLACLPACWTDAADAAVDGCILPLPPGELSPSTQHQSAHHVL